MAEHNYEISEIKNRYGYDESRSLAQILGFLDTLMYFWEDRVTVAPKEKAQLIRDYNTVADEIATEKQRRKLGDS